MNVQWNGIDFFFGRYPLILDLRRRRHLISDGEFHLNQYLYWNYCIVNK